MGLDISYLSKATFYDSIAEDIDNDDDGKIYPQPPFDYQLGSLSNYSNYSDTDESEYGSFRAGSYSGYNHWREQLAKMAGYENPEEVWNDYDAEIERVGETGKMKPFYELICFSDCEGIICSEISAKLYEDFVNFEEKAKNFVENSIENNYFYSKYKEWKEAFRVASDNGLVSFH